MVEKRILRVDLVRHPPASGFSWVDRRFMHEFAPELERDAILLYLFLAAVSDKYGLSHYKDETIEGRIGLGPRAIDWSRKTLLHHSLIAYETPLYQVLTLPRRIVRCATGVKIGNLMRTLMAQSGKEDLS